MFLPKSSSDLNPIEQLFAKTKRGLRKAAQRTFGTISDTFAAELDTVTCQDCGNSLTNARYDQS